MDTYIATVEYFEEFESKMAKDTVLMRAASYSEAVAQIEESFKNTIESIASITAVSDSGVIHLGDGPNVDTIVETILSENSY